MPSLSFYKLYPRISHPDQWTYPSAIWAERQCPALKIYVSLKRGPQQSQAWQWKAIADRGAGYHIPDWLEKIIQEGKIEPLCPSRIRLLPQQKFRSMRSLKAALEQATDNSKFDSSLLELLDLKLRSLVYPDKKLKN